MAKKITESNQASDYQLIENKRDGGMCQKQHHEDTLSQTQNVGNSAEQMIQFPQQINSINIMGKDCYKLKETYQPKIMCGSFWILI